MLILAMPVHGTCRAAFISSERALCSPSASNFRYALSGGIGSGLRKLAMDAILRIVQKTPFWVLALLAIPVVLGIQALKARTISVWRLLIVPAVFIL
jgi:hypothetical protein